MASRVRAILLGLLVVITAKAASARDIKLSTWNLDWLTDRAAGDPAIPDDVGRRTPQDYARLAAYAAHLNADVIGLQEIDSPAVARRIFPGDRYRILMTDDAIPQHVGVAVRQGIPVTVNDELRALDVAAAGAAHHLRGGLDVTLGTGPQALRLLIVHLKTGCWDEPPGERGHSCPILQQQMAVLANWITERQDEGVPFAVLGDFNRRLTLADPMLQDLQGDGPLTLVTAGKASPCWGGEYFIDHILLGNAARGWLAPGSLRVMVYPGASDADRTHLSDHCPVSVRLSLPDGAQGHG